MRAIKSNNKVYVEDKIDASIIYYGDKIEQNEEELYAHLKSKDSLKKLVPFFQLTG